MVRHRIIRHLVNILVSDVIDETERQIAEKHIQTVDDVRHQPAKLARYSPALAAKNKALKAFLYENFYPPSARDAHVVQGTLHPRAHVQRLL